ncbi:hypothetical protein GCM10025867_13860 [Frondihabitans sucicola]|uniref:DUF2970 domain-containing protein n=1 Tax=Frondihabitans sucicola TaxID=1268041 RepID=A0ABN6XZN4_9MICO|nr:hypothetical protein [Frondihabitans sucicola]BDZ49145.1 hypothetical protein GCM10025867_13860 [Frondihabitans sucicola]
MTAHTFALLWGPFAILFGAFFIVFRRTVSNAARARRERQGIRVGPNTQPPLLMALAGGFFMVVGVVALIAALTGAIR